jgi:hypothetical protein
MYLRTATYMKRCVRYMPDTWIRSRTHAFGHTIKRLFCTYVVNYIHRYVLAWICRYVHAYMRADVQMLYPRCCMQIQTIRTATLYAYTRAHSYVRCVRYMHAKYVLCMLCRPAIVTCQTRVHAYLHTWIRCHGTHWDTDNRTYVDVNAYVRAYALHKYKCTRTCWITYVHALSYIQHVRYARGICGTRTFVRKCVLCDTQVRAYVNKYAQSLCHTLHIPTIRE